MRRVLAVAVLVLGLVGGVLPTASAQPAPPDGDFHNVDFVTNLPEAEGATALSFLTAGGTELLVAVGRFGLQTYDLSDPAAPVLLDHLDNDVLMIPGDSEGTFWQNEDMNVDDERDLVFLARDPRAFAGSTATGTAGLYVVDASDPADLELVTFHELPAGHTSTCIEGCRYLWTGGPAKADTMPEDWGGRPIWVTDLTDPADPYTFPDPIDTGRNDGRTDYSHDVQVDAHGVAWVSGAGGVRGYWTSGYHRDPVAGGVRRATPWDPVPYAGGGIEETAAPSRFMHNSVRPVGRDIRKGGVPRGYRPGELLYATEERFANGCASDGAFVIASLKGSEGGQGWRSTPEDPFRLETVGTWSVADKEGSIDSGDCSAHYFELSDGIAAYSWYAQGTRFLDVSDPTDPIQIAYYRPDGGRSWAPYFHGDYVYVADNSRGVDVIALDEGARRARHSRREVLAPRMTARQVALARDTRAQYRPDEVLGWACPVPLT